jgi:hypothetical protein
MAVAFGPVVGLMLLRAKAVAYPRSGGRRARRQPSALAIQKI